MRSFFFNLYTSNMKSINLSGIENGNDDMFLLFLRHSFVINLSHLICNKVLFVSSKASVLPFFIFH